MNMHPGNCVFSVTLYTLSRKRHCFGLLYRPIFDNHQPVLIILVDNKVVLLSTVFNLSVAISFSRRSMQHD